MRLWGVLVRALLMTLLLAAVPGGGWSRYSGGAGRSREVHIKQGRLQGLVLELETPTLKPVDVFLGIPYALAPVGSKRFVPPSAPPTWDGVRRADSFAPVCPQRLPNMQDVSEERYKYIRRLLPYLANSSEDCLYLNIYAPQRENPRVRDRFPVLVFIHGESYEWNSGNPYDGTTLASFGRIIVITLNYRLGILGFLRPEFAPDAVSNLGLLDQIAALQWIKDNIEAFDGDPNNVTLMGHDTGAACVNLLLVSPITEQGLFQRAILMSGSALSDWALTANPQTFTIQVGEGLNCGAKSELLTCLRRRRLDDLMAVPVDAPPFVTPFGPVVDGTSVPNEPEQTMGVYNSLFSRYDLMYGVTQIESYHLFGKEALVYGILEKVRLETLKDYMQARFQIRPDLAVAEAQAMYSGGSWDASSSAEDHRDTLLQMLTDARVVAPVVRTADYHSAVNPRSYFYVFSHRTVFGDYANSKPQGSISGEELAYVFGVPVEGGRHQHSYSFTHFEKQLSRNVMTLWTNFAKTGNPNDPHPVTNSEPVTWPKYDRVSQRYLQIDERLSVDKQYRRRYMEFWNHVLPEKLKKSKEPLFPNTMSPYGPYRPEEDSGVQVSPPWSPPPVYRPPPQPPYYPPTGHEYYENFNKTLHGKQSTVVNDRPDHKTTNVSAADKPHAHAGGDGSEHSQTDEQGGGGGATASTAALADSSSVALTVVIVIGVCFLLVNMCAFAGLYYQRDKLKVQEQLMRQKYEDVTGLATSDEEDAADRYVRKKAETASAAVATVDRKARRKKDMVCGDDDYEAIRSAGRTVEGAAVVEVAAVGEAVGTSAAARRGWGLSRQYSGSTVDPHTKVREWIASEIVQRCSPHFMRRTTRKANSRPVLQSSQSIQTSFDLASSSATPRALKRQHAVETIEVAVSTETPRRHRVKKVSVAVDATSSARGTSAEKTISKSMDELGTCVSKSTLTLQKPALKRSLTMAEDLAAACMPVSPRSSSSGELTRSTANVNLKICPVDSQYQRDQELRIQHAHSRSDPAPHRGEAEYVTAAEQLRVAQSQPLDPQIVDISLDPHSAASVIYVPTRKNNPLQTFPTGIQLRSKALPKKDAAVSVSPIPLDVNVTSRNGKEEDRNPSYDPLSNIQKRNFPKVLPDFPQVTDETNSQSSSAKRRSLPPNSHLMLAYATDVHDSISSVPSSSPSTKGVSGKSSIVRVPPPPPPRISSTLGRKPANNAPITPLPTIPSACVPPHSDSDVRPHASPSSPQVPGSSHYQRTEPKVIIKPTTMGAQTKRAQAARGIQQIPRVTPSDPVTVPLSAPSTAVGTVPRSVAEKRPETDNSIHQGAVKTRHQPSTAVHKVQGSSNLQLQKQPATATAVTSQQKTGGDQAKTAPASPGKKRGQPVLKVTTETSTDPLDETSSNTGTVKRVKRGTTKTVQAQAPAPQPQESQAKAPATDIARTQPPKKWYAQYQQSFISKTKDEGDEHT